MPLLNVLWFTTTLLSVLLLFFPTFVSNFSGSDNRHIALQFLHSVVFVLTYWDYYIFPTHIHTYFSQACLYSHANFQSVNSSNAVSSLLYVVYSGTLDQHISQNVLLIFMEKILQSLQVWFFYSFYITTCTPSIWHSNFSLQTFLT